MKIVLDLNQDEIDLITEALDEWDAGPVNGWCSPERMAAQEKFDEAVKKAEESE